MILRKPYAFLIKYFRRINILLLVLVLFVFYRTNRFHQFAKNYLDTSLYNNQIDSITNYANFYLYLAFSLIIVICLILIYILKRKNKPIFGYLLVLIVNVMTLALFIYSHNYFAFKALDGFKLVTAKMINDLSLIANIAYYPLLLILLIRSLGIDLNSFGFQEDKEYLEINEEDREEIEVEVSFDKEKWIRKVRYYFRNIKYFILEHKLPLFGVFIIVLLIGAFQFYQYFYVDNRIYSMNETISSNNYKLKVKGTYLTDKDYSGKVVSEEGTYFIIVNLEITNTASYSRLFDIERFLLYIDKSYYVPTTRFNKYFKDMGNLYDGKEINGNTTTSYILVYEVPKPSEDANFVLKYQDLNTNSSKLVQIKIKVVDISTFKENGEGSYKDNLSIKLNEEKDINLKITKRQTSNGATYTYKSCDMDGACAVYRKDYYMADDNYRIMTINFDLIDNTREEIIDFISNYAIIRYEVNGEIKEATIKSAINNYLGNNIYLIVPAEIQDATRIDLVFTVRTYRYVYHLRGE